MDEILAPFADPIFGVAKLSTAGVVYDVGCGCGATTLIAARSAARATVVGIDVSEAMLAVARARARAEGLTIGFELADAATAPPPVGPADLILSRFGLMFFEDPAAAFSNLRGWLRPEGHLVTTIWGPVEENPWATSLATVARPYLEIPPPPAEGPGPFSLQDAARVDSLLRDAGFGTVEQQTLSLAMRIPGSLDDVLAFYRDFGAASDLVGEAPPATQQAIMNDLRTYLSGIHDGGGVSLGASSRLVLAHAAR